MDPRHRPATRPRLFTPAFGALFVAALVFFAVGRHGPPGRVAIRGGTARGRRDRRRYLDRGVRHRGAVASTSGRLGIGQVRPPAAADPRWRAHCRGARAASRGGYAALVRVARSLLGIAEAFFFVAAVAAISDLAPPERRGEALNIGSLSLYLGLAIGPVVGETILAGAGFAAVWIGAAAMAAVATGLSLLVPETAPSALRPRVAGERRPRTRLIHPAGILPGS